MKTSVKVGFGGFACLLLILTGCSQGSIDTETTGSSSTGAATTSTVQTESIEATAEEALCSGVQYGIAEFGDAISDPAFHALWDGYTHTDCITEASELLVEISALMGPDRAPETVVGWFEAGCYQSGFVFAAELSGDPDIAELAAISACRTPFQIAEDMGADWDFLPAGVCFHLDFQPTVEQIESGLVPCES